MQREVLGKPEMIDWHSLAVLDPDYRNYAVVIMDRHILWDVDQMLSVWKKAEVRITVNDGLYDWLNFLEDAGINVTEDDIPTEYLPDCVIVELEGEELPDGTSPPGVELMESLGVSVVYLPKNKYLHHVEALTEVANFCDIISPEIKEMYIFAQLGCETTFLKDLSRLYRTNGDIAGIKIIIATSSYLAWILTPGWHRICLTEKQLELKPECGVCVPDTPGIIKSFTAIGLEENYVNVTQAELEQRPFAKYRDPVVHITTDANIIWILGVEFDQETGTSMPPTGTDLDQEPGTSMPQAVIEFGEDPGTSMPQAVIDFGEETGTSMPQAVIDFGEETGTVMDDDDAASITSCTSALSDFSESDDTYIADICGPQDNNDETL